jgi:hypothetical protein
MKSNRSAFLPFAVGVLILGLMGWGIYEGTSSLIKKLQPAQPGATSVALSAGFVPNPLAVAAVPAVEPVPDPANALDAAAAKEKKDASGAKAKKDAEAPPPLFEIQGSVQRNGKPIQRGKVRLTVSLVGERFRQSTLVNLKGGEFKVKDHPAFRLLRPKNRIGVQAEVWPEVSGLGNSKSEPLAETIYLNHHLPPWLRTTGFGVLGGVLLFTILFLWSFTGRSTYAKNRLAIVLSYTVIFLALASAVVGPTLLMLAVPDLPEISGRVPVGLVVAKLTDKSNPEWMLNLGGFVRGREAAASDQQGEVEVVTTAEDEGVGAPVLRVVTLNGGIQIPLYVILLALIGGAINMTRQVPDFQSRQPVQRGLLHWMGGGQPDTDTDADDDDDDEEEEEEEKESGAWRKGLLDQYMFLIAAPFLAIATYYLLILLGTIQPPIIVLVCFSIGLISDTVVTAITETAKKLLGGKPAKTEEDSQPEREKPNPKPEPANANAPVVPIQGEKGAEETEEDKAA